MRSILLGLFLSLAAIIVSIIYLVKFNENYFIYTLLISIASLMYGMGRLFGAW